VTYTNFTIRTPTEAKAKQAALAVLEYDPSFTLLDDDGNWLQGTYRHALDPIGAVWNDDGEVEAETGEQVKAPTKKSGWFANLAVKSDIAPQVEQLLTLVGSPFGLTIGVDTGRVWA
jgi:hypothetical protein